MPENRLRRISQWFSSGCHFECLWMGKNWPLDEEIYFWPTMGYELCTPGLNSNWSWQLFAYCRICVFNANLQIKVKFLILIEFKKIKGCLDNFMAHLYHLSFCEFHLNLMLKRVWINYIIYDFQNIRKFWEPNTAKNLTVNSQVIFKWN